MQENGRTGTGLVLKWIHLVIAVSVYLVSIGAVWATMRTQLDEVREEVRELKQQAILDPQWKEFRQDVERRLQRIEDKLDGKKAIQELSQ